MAYYSITTSNWNNPSFWSAINHGSAGSHTLDFSALPSNFSVDMDATAGLLTLNDGTTTFTIGDNSFGGTPSVSLGGSTLFNYFEVLQGGDGDDSIDTGSGDDTVSGGAGNDTLIGGTGNHDISGGSGNDELISGDGDATLDGGTGDDTLYANFSAANPNVYIGGADLDTLVIDGTPVTNFSYNINLITGIDNYGNTYSGLETIIAGDGNDTLTGDSNDNRLEGRDGADQFNVEDGFGNDTIIGGEGGADDDRVDFSAMTVGISVTYTANEAASATDGTDTLTFTEVEAITLTAQNDSVDATATTAGQNFDGGLGNDSLIGGAGADTIAGGTGADTVLGGTGSDSIDGGIGNDSIEGGTGADTILGGDGNDTLVGGDGGFTPIYAATSGASGTLTGTNGNTDPGYSVVSDGTLTTSGNSYELTDPSDLSETHTHTFDQQVAGAVVEVHDLGFDSFGSAADIYVDGVAIGQLVTDGDATITFTGNAYFITPTGARIWGTGDGDNGAIVTINIPFTEIVVFGGHQTSSADPADLDTNYTLDIDTNPLTGGNDDSIEGGAGDDIITGGAGDDTLAGGDGDDYIDGGAGDDFLTTGLGQDTLMGGEGNDTLMNSDGDDSLDGGAGDDSIVATGGEDTLRGGTGADTMDGGDDADTFIIEDGFGNDVITGGEGTTDGGEQDFDVIDLSALSGPVTVTYDAVGAESGTITDGTDTITFSEIEHLILTDQNDSVDATAVWNGTFGDNPGINVDAGAGNDTIMSGWGGDTIDGGSGNDSIDGDYGDDSIMGGAGQDTLRGGSGNDTLEGGDDNDSLDGGAEADTLIGGAGNDTLLGRDGDDSLQGGDGNDIIDGGNDDDTLEGGDGNDTMLGQSGDDSIDGESGDDLVFGHSGADTISGGAGDDTISGGTGNDSLTGGTGDDTFTYAPGDGNDTITDFNTGNTGTLDDGDSTNNDFIDLSGYYDHLSELYADQADDGILNQSNATSTRGEAVDYSDNSQFSGGSIEMQGASADESSFTAENTGVVCFTAGTAIRTPLGDVLIDDLRVGDLVSTMDNGPQRIRWIGRRAVGGAALRAQVKLRPVLIPKGVLGAERNLFVSRQHALLSGRDHFARAIHLSKTKRGIRIANGKRKVIYIHLMFDQHEVIFAENVPSESFYPGPMALQMFDPAMSHSFFETFPELQRSCASDLDASNLFGAPARYVLALKEMRQAACG